MLVLWILLGAWAVAGCALTAATLWFAYVFLPPAGRPFLPPAGRP